MTDLQIGDWVEFRWLDYANMYARKRTATGQSLSAKVISLDPIVLERWEPAKITKASRVFGHKVNRTPYRVGRQFKESMWTTLGVLTEPRKLHPNVARTCELRLEQTMRLPTKSQRDYAKRKASA